MSLKRASRPIAGWLLAGSVLGAHGTADAAEQGASLRRAHPFTDIGANAVRSFTGTNAVLHGASIVATPLIIATGTDTAVHDTLARHQRLEPWSVGGVVLGYALPLLVGGGLLTAGFAADSQREIVAASAVLQSSLLAVGYQTILKAFTGRPPPPPGVLGSDAASHEFRVGWLRGGVHYGWPSGHMMTVTAVTTSLLKVYPGDVWLAVGGTILVAGMFGSVAIHESSSMHWFSDMAAGTLMGIAIGRGVGAGFSGLVPTEDLGISGLTVSPWTGIRGARGLCVSWAL